MFPWILSASLALAATGSVSLPAAEDPASWEEPLDLADLEAAPAETADVRIEAVDDRWRLVLVSTGAELWEEAPDDPDDREALAHLVRSLIRPVPRVELPPPDPAPARPAPVPDPEPEPAAPLPPLPPTASSEEALPADAVVEPAPEPGPSVWAVEGWARLSGGLAWRDGDGAPGGSLFGGVGAGPVRIGLGALATGPHPIPGAPRHRWANLEGLLGLWFAAPSGPVLGLLGGVGWRRYDGEQSATRAALGAELGWRAPLGEHLDLVPLACVDLDPGAGGLRRTTVTLDGEPLGELAPTGLRLELALWPHR